MYVKRIPRSGRWSMATSQKLRTLNKNQSKFLNAALETLLEDVDKNYDALLDWLLLGEMPQDIIDEFNRRNPVVKTTKIKALGVKALIKNLVEKGLGVDFSKFDNVSLVDTTDLTKVGIKNVVVLPSFTDEQIESLKNAGVDVDRLSDIMKGDKVKFYSSSKKSYIERIVEAYNKGFTKKQENSKIAIETIAPVLKKVVIDQLVDFRKSLTKMEETRVGYQSASNSTYTITLKTEHNNTFTIKGNATKGTYSILKKIDAINNKVLGEKSQSLLVKNGKVYQLNGDITKDLSFVMNNEDPLRHIIAVDSFLQSRENDNKVFAKNIEKYKYQIGGWIDEHASEFKTKDELKKAVGNYLSSDVLKRHFDKADVVANEENGGLLSAVGFISRDIQGDLNENGLTITHTEGGLEYTAGTDTENAYFETLKKGILDYNQKVDQEFWLIYSEIDKYALAKIEEKFGEKVVEKPEEVVPPQPPQPPKPEKQENEQNEDNNKNNKGGIEVNIKISYALVNKDTNMIKTGDNFFSFSEEKRASLLQKTSSFIILGITDEKGNPIPLTKEIVDQIAVENIQITQNVKNISKGAFTHANIKQVTFQDAHKAFDPEDINGSTKIEEGAFGDGVKILSYGVRKKFTTVEGKPRFTGEQNLYYEYTPELFMKYYNSGSIHKRMNSNKIFTPKSVEKPDPIDEEELLRVKKETKKEPKVVDPNTSKPQGNNRREKIKGLVVPFALDHDRSFNSGWGKFLKWTIKSPVVSTLALTSIIMMTVLLGSTFIPAFKVLFASMELISTSIVVGSFIVAGLIELTKQFCKIFSKRYRSMFLKDKAMKISKKIRTKLNTIHNNILKAEEMIQNEIGLLHGNATKERGKKALSVRNKGQIKNWHSKYVEMLNEAKKLKKKADKHKIKLDKTMDKIENLENEIGGEHEEKANRRLARRKNLDNAFAVYETAIKEMGRLYEQDDEIAPEGESTGENIMKYYERKRKASKVEPVVNKDELNSQITGEIKEEITERLDDITEEVHDLTFQGRSTYQEEVNNNSVGRDRNNSSHDGAVKE